ncbi:hypothetical protein HDU76_004536, partial [Blyttiomyces sp. JEL0837]
MQQCKLTIVESQKRLEYLESELRKLQNKMGITRGDSDHAINNSAGVGVGAGGFGEYRSKTADFGSSGYGYQQQQQQHQQGPIVPGPMGPMGPGMGMAPGGGGMVDTTNMMMMDGTTMTPGVANTMGRSGSRPNMNMNYSAKRMSDPNISGMGTPNLGLPGGGAAGAHRPSFSPQNSGVFDRVLNVLGVGKR